MAVVERLHSFETQLQEWRKRVEGGHEDVLAVEVFGDWVTEIDYAGWLEADMQVLHEMLRPAAGSQTRQVGASFNHHRR